MKDQHFLRKIMLAIGLGIIAGFIFKDYLIIFETIGKIFLRAMQMAIPLLVAGQVVQALGALEKKDLSALGLKTIAVFGISSVLAAYWGILFALVFQPGKGVTVKNVAADAVQEQTINISETLIEFVPQNFINALTQGSIIQVIIFAIFMGIAVNRYTSRKPDNLFLPLLIDFNEIIMDIIRLVMKFAPVGIFAMIAVSVGNLGLEILLPLVKYLLVFGAATVSFLLIWIVVVALYSKKTVVSIIKGVKSISLMALVTTSSAVTLPIALEDTHQKLGVSKRIVDLVLPMGVSLNSNGSAMHMAITAITVAQLYDIEFNLVSLAYLGILATFVSLANAVVPGAGLVSLAIIIPQLGLPVESIALFAGVEWFVGMLRTITNVNSDVFSAIIVEGTERQATG
ncbi:TPA: dicarboxylate/amino acid:cation symporter [Streptococcus suis]|nr:dicarboxylate/amino acid:cation symporter [Streptococcus suis]HEM3641917.1 dicarboxylate/amino acid:cation symporter [Streptococcus suis]HEM3666493.1 dicarboxylate/amino acid:cation symporter [Streptococcus suis]HEM3720588.1 dicarboxylate/amino acid:cation symporter [Streptococcus suis]